MSKKRAFISFDYDHDENLKTLLVGQSKPSDTPFDLADWSIKEHITGDWTKKAQSRIASVDVPINGGTTGRLSSSCLDKNFYFCVDC